MTGRQPVWCGRTGGPWKALHHGARRTRSQWEPSAATRCQAPRPRAIMGSERGQWEAR